MKANHKFYYLKMGVEEGIQITFKYKYADLWMLFKNCLIQTLPLDWYDIKINIVCTVYVYIYIFLFSLIFLNSFE